MLDGEALESIARAAGALAAQMADTATGHRKGDGSVVTDADAAVQRLILQRLRALEPDPARLGVVAEEERDDEPPSLAETLSAQQIVAVDPIDGTSVYAAGMGLWAVSLGLLEEARPRAGVVFVPEVGGPRGRLYRVDREGPAWLDGRALPPLGPRDPSLPEQIGVPSGFLRGPGLPGFAGKMRSLGSTAHHGALVAAGALDAAVLGVAYIWDVAAVVALVERVGGVVETLSGAPLDWGELLAGRRSQPLLAGSPAAVERLRERLVRARLGTATGSARTK